MQCPGDQIQQPRAHDATVAPDLGDLSEIEVKLLFGPHEVEPFRKRLHQPILDAVVDHLDKVAGTGRSDMPPAAVRRRSQRLKDRSKATDTLLVAADHQAEPLSQPPDAAAGADIEEVQAALSYLRGPVHGVAVVRIAAVNDDVAGRQQGQETVDRVIHWLPGGDHQPHRPWRSELPGECGQRIGTDPSPLSHALHALRAGIIPHHPMATLH
jgi:hypothetical protein